MTDVGNADDDEEEDADDEADAEELGLSRLLL